MHHLLKAEFDQVLGRSKGMSLGYVERNYLSVFLRAGKSDPESVREVVTLVREVIAAYRINLVSGLYILIQLADLGDEVRKVILEEMPVDTLSYYEDDEELAVRENARVLSAILLGGKRLGDFPQKSNLSDEKNVVAIHGDGNTIVHGNGNVVAVSDKSGQETSVSESPKWKIAGLVVAVVGTIAVPVWQHMRQSATQNSSSPAIWRQFINAPVQFAFGGNNIITSIAQDPETYFIAGSTREEGHILDDGKYEIVFSLMPVGTKDVPVLTIVAETSGEVKVLSIIPIGYRGIAPFSKTATSTSYTFANIPPVEQRVKFVFDKKPDRLAVHWHPDKLR